MVLKCTIVSKHLHLGKRCNWDYVSRVISMWDWWQGSALAPFQSLALPLCLDNLPSMICSVESFRLNLHPICVVRLTCRRSWNSMAVLQHCRHYYYYWGFPLLNGMVQLTFPKSFSVNQLIFQQYYSNCFLPGTVYLLPCTTLEVMSVKWRRRVTWCGDLHRMD